MKRKILAVILCVMTAAAIGVSGAVAAASAYDLTIEQWGIEYFNKLDCGLYWYSDVNDDVPTKDYVFDKNKPTIVYTHGWKPSESNVREGLSLKSRTAAAFAKKGFPSYEYDTEFYRYYINNGYNVGVFFWNQLADNEGDSSVLVPDFSVDQKIWTANLANGMTYITYDNVNAVKGKKTAADDPTNPKKSVAMLFAESIVEVIGKDYESDLQLAGHSMGGQLVLAGGEYMCILRDKGEINYLPARVTLLDPYLEGLTPFPSTVTVDHSGKTYEYDAQNNDPVITVAELAADAAVNIRKHGVPIEGYIANKDMCVQNYYLINQMKGEANKQRAAEVREKFKENCVWVYAKGLMLYGGFDPTHVMCVDYYFTTNNMKPVKSTEGLTVPCAQVPTEELRQMIGLTFLQKTPGRVNPAYYDRSTYSLVDFNTCEPYKADQPTGRIFGRLELTGAKGKTLAAELTDADGKTVKKTVVDDKGYYVFNEVADGDYTIKLSVNDKENRVIAPVTVSKDTTSSGFPLVVETQQVSLAADIDKYITMAVVAVLGIVLILGFAMGIKQSARIRRMKNE